MTTQITKDMIISDILALDPNMAGILVGQGMHCVFCGVAENETLAEACMVHGIPEESVDLLVAQLNDFLAGPPAEE